MPVDPSPIKFKYPPGLVVVEEFITPEEEAMLMNLIDWGDAPMSTAEGMFKGEKFGGITQNSILYRQNEFLMMSF